ncbi:MAG: LacI family transcriptional regulator [Ruminococcaceae bacterium]|nr:LacI family transcriptional regulator [Oscillospiraceae bacterium]
MATIRDVAKLANVDVSTVSRALNNKENVHPETKRRILKAVEDLCYQPNMLARGLKERRSHTIALLMPGFGTSVFTSVAEGVEFAARGNDYTVIVCNTEGNPRIEAAYINKLKNRFVDGFVCTTITSHSHHILSLKEEGIPVVLAVRMIDHSIDAVVMDYFKAAYDATMYLLDKGCRNICLINGSLDSIPFTDRYRGHLKALADCGILWDERNIENTEQSTFVNGFEAMTRLLNQHRQIDGVLASTDALAIGAIRALRKQSLRIPEDVKLIDCTGNPITAMLETPLTVMEMPGFKIGMQAATRLIELIEGTEDPAPVITRFEAELIEREST